jgi:hypothetical protein
MFFHTYNATMSFCDLPSIYICPLILIERRNINIFFRLERQYILLLGLKDLLQSVKIIATMGLRSIFVFVLLMVIVMHYSVCEKDFGWEEGDPCEDIPYPFGIEGTAVSGFELKCQDGKATLLSSNNQSYPIQSIQNSGVYVRTGILYKRCYNNDGYETIEDNSGLLDFEGTPYTTAGEVKLVLFGCDDSMTVRYDNYAEQFKCTASCNRLANFNQTDECLGLF